MDVSPSKILQRIQHFLHEYLHNLIALGGLAYALAKYARTVQWPHFELERGVVEGLAVAMLGVLLGQAIKWQLRFSDTAAMSMKLEPLDPTPRFRLLSVRSEEDIERLARFVSKIYPSNLVSHVGTRERTETYQRWLHHCPGFACLLLDSTAKEADQIVGFSIILRTTYETYVAYRNGRSDPWTWDHNQLLRPNALNEAFLFTQGLYCSKHRTGPGAGQALRRMFVEHARAICQEAATEAPVFFAPGRQRQTQRTYRDLGFEQARMSRGGFNVWELDCRRIEELSVAAGCTYKDLVVALPHNFTLTDGRQALIRPFRASDYPDVHRLWMREGVLLRDADDREMIEKYLQRNSSLSLIAELNGGIIGVLLCGHDGRAGYIHHLAIESIHRHVGLGTELVNHATAALAARGIARCHSFVFNDNAAAQSFWTNVRWQKRVELSTFTKSSDNHGST